MSVNCVPEFPFEEAHAGKQAEQRAMEMAALHALGLAVCTSLSLEQISAAALRGMMEAAQPDMSFLFLRQGDRLVLQGLLPPHAEQWLGAIPEHQVGECFCGLTVRTGAPAYSRNIHTDPRCTWMECKRAGVRSMATLPLKSDTEIMGVIGLASMTERDFESQADFLETLARQVAMALANARLYEAAQRELAERKKTEATLRESDKALEDLTAHHEALLDAIPDIIMEVDANKVYSWTNQAGLDFFGEDVIGREAAYYFEGEQDTYDQVSPLFHGDEGVIYVESWQRRKDGQKRLLAWWCRVLKDAAGKVTGAISSARDITDARHMEEEKERLRAQLLQAQKMESVGRLAGGVAHDFNNILSVIMGYSDILLDQLPSDSRMTEYARQIKESTQRAASLTRQLLAFSRKQVLEIRVVSINSLIEDTSKMLRRMIGEDIALELRTSAPASAVLADPAHLEQVLMNLAVNARDAMPDGGRLVIETAVVEVGPEGDVGREGMKAGCYIMISVADTGSGMTPETQERIFEPFFTTKETNKGTGLGLATVYGIVKQHKGYIFVFSEPGQGTIFRIYLPALTGQGSESTGQSAGEITRGTETILVVEDEPFLREFLRQALQPLGYKALMTASGEEALALNSVFQGPIHLLLTDVIMPGINGRELADRLQAERAGLKVIFMSGYTDDVITHHGVLKAGTAFLQKPLTISKLAGKIREMLDT